MWLSRSSFVRLIGIAAVSVVVTTGTTTFAQTTIQGKAAQKFVDSLGVSTHLDYNVTKPYGNYPVINSKLQALGILHFRNEITDTSDSSFVNELNVVGGLGLNLLGIIGDNGNSYPPPGTKLSASSVIPMIHNLEPTIEAVEEPNEPDGGLVYNGVAFPQGAVNYAQDLWNIVKGSSLTSNLPVVGLSEANAADFPQLSAITSPPLNYASTGNMHAYQGGNVGDYNLTAWYIPYSQGYSGTLPLWTTEMGYHNYTKYLGNGEQQGVSQRAGAIYLPIAFFAGFNQGVVHTFSYEFIDETDDPNLTSGTGEGHYGLLNHDFTPKPAYTTLQNLISILKEPGQQNFQAGSLTVTFSGAPSTMGYTLLEKSTGIYCLALWNDVSVYQIATNNVPGNDLYPSNVPVTLTFSTPHAFSVYAPNDSTGVNPTSTYTLSTASNSISLNLPAEVLLLQITNTQYPAPTVTLGPSAQTVQAGNFATLTALVDTANNITPPTGTVSFLSQLAGSAIPGNPTYTQVTDGNGNEALQAVFSYTPAASDTVAANYSGDTQYPSANSGNVQVVVSGTDFTFSVSPDSVSVIPGQSATLKAPVGLQSNAAAVIFGPCTGLPAESTCGVSPSSISSNSTAVLTVTTTGPHTVAANRLPALDTGGVWTTGFGLAFACVFLPGGLRRRRRSALPALAVVTLLVMGPGCGGGGGGGGHTDPGTPAGSYNVTLTATSGSLTHSTTFTLVVQ